MNARKMTREEYEEARAKIIAMGYVTNGDVQQFAEAFGIIVESEPILPGVTPGEWDCKQRNLANRRDEDFPCEVWGYSEEGIKMTIGWVRRLEDAVPMAGVKELVELNVAGLRAAKAHEKFDHFSDEVLAVIDQLEEMGVSVKEFKGDK